MGILKESVGMEVDEGQEEEETMDEEEEDIKEDEEDEEVEEAPVVKKVKRDVTKEVEEELKIIDEIVKDSEIDFPDKLTKLSSYFESIVAKNVNTLEFQNNFNDWVKSSLILLLEEGSTATCEFYDFLCNVLKVAPTIVESSCEVILGFIFAKHQFSPESNQRFEDFMECLSVTFEKLRRYPKLIAKLLRIVRANLSKDKFLKKMLGQKLKLQEIFILPKRFLDSFSSIVSVLTPGYVVDLWTTFQYNLEEECVKRLLQENTKGVMSFFAVVVELTTTFLASIKVADYSVPASTVERVQEMMRKLKESCLSKLGPMFSTYSDESFTRSFLKLCNSWAHLDHFLGVYNSKYNGCLMELVADTYDGVDVSYIIPYVSGDEWSQKWDESISNEDTTSSSLMVNLVGLKLKIFARIHQATLKIGNKENDDIEISPLEVSIQNAAKFVWDHQEILLTGSPSRSVDNEDTLRIVTAYLPSSQLIEYAKEYVSKKVKPSHYTLPSPEKLSSHMKFRVAVVLELISEGVHRVGKMTSMKHSVKSFISKCLNQTSKLEILDSLDQETLSPQVKESLNEAIQIVNSLITTNLNEADSDEDLSVELLQEIVSLICQEQLIQCPTSLKTVTCLTTLIIFLALVKQGKELKGNVVPEVIMILSECARQSSGNDILFHMSWIELYGLVKKRINFIPQSSVGQLSDVILENIYVSPKIGTEFGSQYIQNMEDFDFSSAEGNLAICALNFTLRIISEKKNKSLPILNNHASTLCTVVKRKFSDGSVISACHSIVNALKKKRKSLSSQSESIDATLVTVSNIMRCCYLIQKGKSIMNKDDASDVDVRMIPFMNFAIEYMEGSNKILKKGVDPSVTDCRDQIIQFLNEALISFSSKRDHLPEDFIVRIWNGVSSSDCAHLLKQIVEVSNENEFQAICGSIIEQMDNPGSVASGVLNTLIEAEISNDEKKKIRRAIIQKSLFKYLELSNVDQDIGDLVQLAVPHLQFQTSLLKRRKPMGNLTTLSVCLSSVSSFPLEKVKPVNEFKSIFSLLCELLNAMNVHRIDVLAFRSHIFVQCFQFLVEHLVKRGDQKNDLSDREIYDLRHCAHCIERICQSAKLGKNELGRVAPYLVVVLLRPFEKTTVYPHVKNPLLNGCYKLLDMCDTQGISHVNSMLSAGSREIFKTVYDMYKKFYRYKGKV